MGTAKVMRRKFLTDNFTLGAAECNGRGPKNLTFVSLQIVLRQDFMKTHGQLSWAGSSTNTNLCFEAEFSECMIMRKLFNLGNDLHQIYFFQDQFAWILPF